MWLLLAIACGGGDGPTPLKKLVLDLLELPDDPIQGFALDASETPWVSVGNVPIVYVEDPEKHGGWDDREYPERQNDLPEQYWDMRADPLGEGILFQGWDGVYRVDRDSFELLNTADPGLYLRGVLGFDPKEQLWARSERPDTYHDLYALLDGGPRVFTKIESMPFQMRYTAAANHPDGRLILFTEKGIWAVGDDSVPTEIESCLPPSPCSGITVAVPSPDGSLLIAVDGGIKRIGASGPSLDWLDLPSGYEGRPTGIAFDRDGRLWVSRVDGDSVDVQMFDLATEDLPTAREEVETPFTGFTATTGITGTGTSDLYLVDVGFEAGLQVIRFPAVED